MPREENRAWTPRKDHMHAYIVSQALPYMKHILNYLIRTTGITYMYSSHVFYTFILGDHQELRGVLISQIFTKTQISFLAYLQVGPSS